LVLSPKQSYTQTVPKTSRAQVKDVATPA
jgi:hypothetical protein